MSPTPNSKAETYRRDRGEQFPVRHEQDGTWFLVTMDPDSWYKTEATASSTMYDSMEPGVPYVLVFKFTTGSLAKGTVPLVATTDYAFRIMGAKWCSLSAVTGATVQLKNGSTAISDAMDVASDNAAVEAGELDQDQALIEEADTLNAVFGATGANRTTGILFVTIIREQD